MRGMFEGLDQNAVRNGKEEILKIWKTRFERLTLYQKEKTEKEG